jgi:hypothetical protein
VYRFTAPRSSRWAALPWQKALLPCHACSDSFAYSQ